MYDLINKILEKSKKENVDIGVAYDMLVSENGADENLKDAWEFLQENQTEIHKLRNAGRENEIKVLCNMAVAKDERAIRKYLIALYDEGIIER